MVDQQPEPKLQCKMVIADKTVVHYSELFDVQMTVHCDIFL